MVRVSAMAGRGFLFDEVTLAASLEQSYGELLQSFGRPLTQPLYLLLGKTSGELFGDLIGIEAALRLPSLLCGVLAIWLIRLGLRDERARHRRLARIAWPIWMYVSITGVAIYLLLYPFNPPPIATGLG